MYLGSKPGEGNLIICFRPREAEKFALLMELVFEEERERGTFVPTFEEDFFEKLAKSEEEISIEFPFQFLEVGIIFLEEIYLEMLEDDCDTSVIEHFLDRISPLCGDNSVLH